MFSTGKKSASKPPPKHSKSSKEPSKSESSQKQPPGKNSDWGEWEWDEQWQRYWRSRELTDGNWDYEYDYPKGELPPPTRQNREHEQKEEPAYTTNTDYGASQSHMAPYGTAAGPRSAHGQGSLPVPISSITTGVGGLDISSAQAPYSGLSYGRGAFSQSMVDEAGVPTTESKVQPNVRAGYYRGYEGGGGEEGEDQDSGDDDDDDEEEAEEEAEENEPLGSLDENKQSYRTHPVSTFYPQRTTASSHFGYGAQKDEAPSVSNESHRLVITGDDEEIKDNALNPEFKVHPAKRFKFGKVFKILWTEPAGQVAGSKPKGTELVSTKFGEGCYTSVRRFAIVRVKEGHCLCLPILTYGRQATRKRGVKPHDHAIVYMDEEAKKSSKGKKDKIKKEEKGKVPTEVEGEEKLRKRAIRIKPLSPRDRLDKLSRLNYAKIYTVEYNVKVCFIGSVHEDSLKYFTRDFNLTHAPLPQEANTEFSDDGDDAGPPPQAEPRISEHRHRREKQYSK